MHAFRNFINGDFRDSASGQTLPVYEPATGDQYATAPASDANDVDAAVRSAAAAFPAWASTPAAERAAILLRLADLIDANTQRLAEMEARDSGKPVSLAANVDIPRSASNFRYFAGAVQHTTGEFHETDTAAVGGRAHALNYTLRRPRGVAGLISPWNLPLYLLTWKIAPALATGNTAVCKPSEVTPATATVLCELAAQAGLPPGVLNIVHGAGQAAGAALVTHPLVPAVSFTGSTAVGQWIGRHAGAMLKRISLELGGKNPFVIFADAELDGEHGAIATACRAAFTNQGQICLCGSRLLVERTVYPRVRDALLARAKAMRIGDPMDPATQLGALVSREHHAKVSAAVDRARALGGRVLCGGAPVEPAALPQRCRGGCFYPPTVIEGLDPACDVEQEEIFGPVVTLQPFDDDAHALRLANGTPFGLAATLWTSNVERAHRIAAGLEAGIIWINCWMLRDLRTSGR